MRPRTGLALLGWALCVLASGANSAAAQSDLDLTLDQYMAQAGDAAKLIAYGQLRIDGRRMICGRRPTVMDPNFDSWGGAYPGFVILNPKRLEGLATTVKLYVYAHELHCQAERQRRPFRRPETLRDHAALLQGGRAAGPAHGRQGSALKSLDPDRGLRAP